jgi:branched-chain amino acid aminotransferase
LESHGAEHPADIAKAGGNYLNSQLIKMEAIANGYSEGIALDTNGNISEGSGENIFVIRNSKIHTPPLSNSVLPGITRDTVVKLAGRLGYEVVESVIPREMLYLADEIFFTGTAAEISPIRSVDKYKIGSGKRGPITKALQEEFFAVVEGNAEDRFGWLTPVPTAVAV